MDIWGIIIAVALGSVMGVVAGLLPGISVGKILLLAVLLIQDFNPVELMVVYISLLVVGQYMDAVPAIFLGVPGETSAIPTAAESRGLRDRGLALHAVRLTALGRMLGSLAVLVVTVPLMSSMLSAAWVFSVKAQMVVLTMALIGIAVTGRNLWWQNGLLMIAGFVLAAVGYNFYFDVNVLTFGIPDLYDGLPLICVMLGLYVTPMIMDFQGFPANNLGAQQHDTAANGVREYGNTIAKSGFGGSIIGLIPGVSYILSSNMAYMMTKRRRIQEGRYQPGDLHTVVASETATNTGAFSSLLPLVMFGIPITLSESIIWSLMVDNNANFANGQFLTNNWPVLVAVFLIVNVIGLVLAWPLARPILQQFVRVPINILKVLTVIICVWTVYQMGAFNGVASFYLVCYAALTAIGFMIRRLDLLPLIFVFIVQTPIEKAFMTAYNLYF